MSRRAFIVCLLSGSAALATPPTFEVLPSTVGGSGSLRVLARGVSGDGQVVAGSSAVFNSERPYVWRRVGGVWVQSGLPGEGAQQLGRAVSLSRTGDTIAGMTNLYLSSAVAFGTPAVWTGVLSGMPVVSSPLDDIPAQVRRGVFAGISADGAFMAGFAKPPMPTTLPGEIWSLGPSGPGQVSPAGSPISFGSGLLCGNAVSADGTIVVGSGYDGARGLACRWTAATGFVSLPTPDSIYRNSRAETISRDGAVIGGHVTTNPSAYNTDGKPVVWSALGREDLPVVAGPGGTEGRVLALSGDGRIAGGVQYSGFLSIESPPGFGDARAVLWTGGPGGWQAQTLAAYLTALGVNLQGVAPNWVTGISDDGSVIVGFGTRTMPSDVVSFVVTFRGFCAGDINGDGVIDFADYLAFLNLFDAQNPAADLNGDGVVDFGDYLEFLNHYDAGC